MVVRSSGFRMDEFSSAFAVRMFFSIVAFYEKVRRVEGICSGARSCSLVLVFSR